MKCANCKYNKCVDCEKNIKHGFHICSYSCNEYFLDRDYMGQFNEEDEKKFFEIFEYPKNHVKNSPNRKIIIRQTRNNFYYFYYIEKTQKNIITISNIPFLGNYKIECINKELEKKKPLNIVFNEEDLINYIFDCNKKYEIKYYSPEYDMFINNVFHDSKYKNVYYLSKYRDNILKIENAYVKGKLKEESNARYTKAAIKK